MKAASVEPALVVWIPSKPMDPQNIYLHCIWMSHRPDLDMKNAQDLGIPVQMPIGFLVALMSQGHNVWAGVDIDRVLRPTHIVGSVVDMEDFMWVYAVRHDCDAVAFCIRERVLIAIIWDVVVAGQ
jgi:hypothetical protein